MAQAQNGPPTYLNVGLQGNGTLYIRNGGTVSSQYGYIAYDFSPVTSSVAIDGSGSAWNNSGMLYVGYGYTGR